VWSTTELLDLAVELSARMDLDNKWLPLTVAATVKQLEAEKIPCPPALVELIENTWDKLITGGKCGHFIVISTDTNMNDTYL
jgi:hypothetical protein